VQPGEEAQEAYLWRRRRLSAELLLFGLEIKGEGCVGGGLLAWSGEETKPGSGRRGKRVKESREVMWISV
jgi:hypothetical protein